MASATFYLVAAPDGFVPWADNPISGPGQTLKSAGAPEGFEPGALTVGETPVAALHTSNVGWPCQLWKVEAAPQSKLKSVLRRSDHFEVDQCTLIEELPAELVLGPAADELLGLFRALRHLNLADLRVAQSTDDEWWEAVDESLSMEEADKLYDQSDYYRRYGRVGELITAAGLDHVQQAANHYVEELTDRLTGPLWVTEMLTRGADSRRERYRGLQGEMSNAAKEAVRALVCPDTSLDDADALCENLRRFCGIDMTADRRADAAVR